MVAYAAVAEDMMILSRRKSLTGSIASILIARSALAEDENQQIALLDPGGYVAAASVEEAHQRNVVIPPKVRGLRMPELPRDGDGREGWVRVAMSVFKNGRIGELEVNISYPPKLYDRVVLASARSLSFSPGSVNGQVRDTHGWLMNVYFQSNMERGVSAATYDLMKMALTAFRDQHPDQAEASIAKLQEIKDKGEFNLTELARFSELAARRAYARERWIEANEYLRDMLSLGKFIDSESALEIAYRMRLAVQLKLSNFDQAVDFYDAIKQVSPQHLEEFSATIEALRAKGYGKGVVYDLPTLQKMQGGAKYQSPARAL